MVSWVPLAYFQELEAQEVSVEAVEKAASGVQPFAFLKRQNVLSVFSLNDEVPRQP